MVELSLAAPTQGPETEASSPETEPQQQPAEPPTPPTEQAAVTPPESQPEPEPPPPEAAPEPEITIDLPPPDEPPPLKVADLKPVEQPKPKPPAAKPPPAVRPSAKPPAVAQAPSPNTGTDTSTQQAAASAPLIVFEGKPRYRVPPTPPVYPQRAVELNQQGEALVRVRLEPDGSAAEILLWRGSGFALLDRAALTAVRGWQFLPAMRDGRPVAAWVEIPVRFHLR